jgi:hypothetical protein
MSKDILLFEIRKLGYSETDNVGGRLAVSHIHTINWLQTDNTVSLPLFLCHKNKGYVTEINISKEY